MLKKKAKYKVMVWEGLDPIYIKEFRGLTGAVLKVNEYRRAYKNQAVAFIVDLATGEVIEGL